MIQPLKRGGGEGRWSRIHWKGEWDQLRESTIVHHRLTHNRCSTVRSLMQHSFASGHHSAAAGSECIPAAGLQATTDTSSHTTQQLPGQVHRQHQRQQQPQRQKQQQQLQPRHQQSPTKATNQIRNALLCQIQLGGIAKTTETHATCSHAGEERERQCAG